MNGVGVNSEQWFKMAEIAQETRRTDPKNIRIQAARLEIRRNFFLTECQLPGTMSQAG
jgi:hypothetical protein